MSCCELCCMTLPWKNRMQFVLQILRVAFRPPHVRSFPTITNHDVLADCSIPDNIRILCFDTVATHTGTKGGVCGRDFLHLACRPHILEIVHVLVNAFLSLHSRSISESNNVHSGPSSIRRPIGQHQSKIERSEGRGSSSER